MIIVIGGTKGGTGKSTIVMNLAAIDVTSGNDSVLVDADKQGSASAWAAQREVSGVLRVPTFKKFGQLPVTNELKELARKYKNVFVDAGGYDSEELRASLLACNKLLIPIRPSQLDIWTLPRIIEIVSQSQMYNPHLSVLFVINGAHTNPSVKETEGVLELANDVEGMVFCQTVLHHRRAFVKAAAQGLSVVELKGSDRDQKASDEIMNLYYEVTNGR
jgi:chromosome partitioning protein